MRGMALEMSEQVSALPNSGTINPFQATPNELLPEGTFRNFRGFLMCECQIVPESAIDLGFLEQEVIQSPESCGHSEFCGAGS